MKTISLRLRSVVLFLSLGLTLTVSQAGCASPSSDSPTTVENDYAQYWSVLQNVRADPGVPVASLESVAAGLLLRSLTSDVTSMRAIGDVYVGAPQRKVQSVEVDGDRAYVLDCVDISSWLLAPEATKIAISGQLIQPGASLYEFTLAQKDEYWFVTVSQQVDSCTL